jgi:hypothetical protein
VGSPPSIAFRRDRKTRRSAPGKKIGKSLEAHVEIVNKPDPTQAIDIKSEVPLLEELFLVSKVVVNPLPMANKPSPSPASKSSA